jgi:WD40 repeat protein
MVSVGEDSAARISRAETGRQTHAIEHNDWVEDAAFSPDSRWFATASDDNLVRVFDADRGVEKLRMSHGSFVQRVAVSPDGNWIASTGYDFSARIWNAQTGAMMLEASLDGIGSALSFSPDGKRLIVGDRSGNVTIWDISSLDARVGYIQFTEFVNQAKFDPAGGWMLFNTDDKILWQIPADQLTAIHDGTLGINLLSFEDLTAQMKISPNSQWVALSENSEIGRSGAVLFNLETQVEHFLPHGSDITGLAISPDGRLLATTNENNTQVQIWNIESGGQAGVIPFEETAFTAAYSPRDPLLAIGLSDEIALWDTSTNSPAAVLRHVGEIISLDFNSVGNWLATTSSDGSVYVWDMDQGDFTKPKYEFQQGGRITSLDFNAEKHWLASAGLDGFVYVWDLDTGQELVRIPHDGAISGINFSPNGSLLATVSRKTVQFWDADLLRLIATQDLEAAACARLVRNLSASQWEFFFNQDPYEPLCENLP